MSELVQGQLRLHTEQHQTSGSDSDSEQLSQLQVHCTQLQLQYSQLQAQNTQLAAEHKHLQSQFSINLNSSLKPQLTHLTATHKALQAQYIESETQYMQHNASELVVREQLQAQINELNGRLTEMQSVQSDSDHNRSEPPSPDTSLSNTTLSIQKRSRRSQWQSVLSARTATTTDTATDTAPTVATTTPREQVA